MSKKPGNLAKDVVDILSGKQKRPEPTPTDAPGIVKRFDNGDMYVQVYGGADETRVKRTIDAKVGDRVHVRIDKSGAHLTGNESAPPTDDKRANLAHKVATSAESIAESAQEAIDEQQEYFWHDGNGAHVLGSKSGYRNDIQSDGMHIIKTASGNEVAYFGADGTKLSNINGQVVFDIDPSGDTVDVIFAQAPDIAELYPNTPVTVTMDSTYFGSFSDDLTNNLIGNDEYSYVSDVDYNADFSYTVNDLLIEYSYADKTITFTYTGTNDYRDLVFHTVIMWTSTINPPAYTIGTRQGSNGAFSTAIGTGITAEYANQIAIGKNNSNSEENVFEIGDGEAPNLPSNVLEVPKEDAIYSKYGGRLVSGAALLSISNATRANTSSAIFSSGVSTVVLNNNLFGAGTYVITVKRSGWYKLSVYCIWSAVPNTTNVRTLALCPNSAGNYYSGYAASRGNTYESASGSTIVHISENTEIALTGRTEGGSCTIAYGIGIIEPVWLS